MITTSIEMEVTNKRLARLKAKLAKVLYQGPRVKTLKRRVKLAQAEATLRREIEKEVTSNQQKD